MKLTIIGTGYVGLVTGLGFAEMGHSVLCYDNDTNKINTLLNSTVPIFEAETTRLLQEYQNKKIHFTNELEQAATYSDLMFLCLGFSRKYEPGTELKSLIRFVSELSKLRKKQRRKKTVLVIKSTLPLGTHEKLEAQLQKRRLTDFEIVTNPEFLSEGEAVQNFRQPSRIVLASNAPWALKKMKSLYSPLQSPILTVSPTSAEMIKHAANSCLATKISFINEISRLCESYGADLTMVKNGLGLDPRIGPAFLNAGIGYGGSCLPKDVSGLLRAGKNSNDDLPLLGAVEKTNRLQIQRTASSILRLVKKNRLKTITVWGASFKGGTDDIRSSPAIEVLKILLHEKLSVRLYDPAALENVKPLNLSGKITLSPSLQDSVEDSEMVVILTDWNDFKTAPYKKLKSKMKSAFVFDGRIILSADKMKALGFRYYSIGKCL